MRACSQSRLFYLRRIGRSTAELRQEILFLLNNILNGVENESKM